MAQKSRDILKSYFEEGDKPTQSQFEDLVDSLALKTELDSQDAKLAQLDQKVQEDIAGIKPVVINGDVVNAADEEDITSEDNLLKLKNRDDALGMGYVILRKNKTFAEQVTKANTIYEIRYDFDLKGEEFTMCKKCILFFNGGSLSNGTIIGDGTSIKASNYEIFKHGESSFRGYKKDNIYGYVHRKTNAITIGGTWVNKHVSPYWVGLLESSSCHSLQINNYIKLHDKGEYVVFPYGRKYIIYDTIRADGYSVDFNSSTFMLPNDYAEIEDESLQLPIGAEGVSMRHPGYCLWCGGENITIAGLTIDENKESRNEDAAGLGIQFAVNIVNTSHNVTTKDCRFINLVDCGHQIGADPYDLSFENCEWSNVGEHGLYCYTTKGATRFTHCKFENCGQSPYLYSLRGSSACYRPHITMDADNYGKSDLLTTFENCTFHCNGNYNVLTMYEGCPTTKFIRCSWTGNKIAGYGAVLNGIRLSYCEFWECDNPCSPYAGNNMGDTIRTLRNCINVTNPFNCTSLVDNCECIIQYDDVYTRFSSSFSDEVRKALIVKNSSITYKGGNVVFRNKGRDIFFENCHIIKESDVDATIGFNEPNGDTNISLINCIIDAPAGQLLYTAADVYINKFTISGGVILNCSKALTSASVNKLTISGLFSNLSDESGRYVRTVKNSWRINALAQDINNRYYHESYVYLSEGGYLCSS